MLNLNAGNSGAGEIEDKDVIATVQPMDMEDIMQKIKLTADNAAITTSDLATVIGRVKTGKGAVGKLFMNTFFAETLD